MTKYVALLRGIGPSNPHMHGANLKATAESLGLSNVQMLLSSGNVLFESNSKDQAKLETMLEKAWPQKLGFTSRTIVRSQQQLQSLLNADPYKGARHANLSKSYQLVTFFRTPPKTPPKENYYTVLGVNALCSSLDNSGSNPDTPKFMAQLDKQYDEDQITSRTWLTINRILKKMEP